MNGKFKLEIKLGNSAMGNKYDVAVALKQIAYKLEHDIDGKNIMDINGNKVGTFEIIEKVI